MSVIELKGIWPESAAPSCLSEVALPTRLRNTFERVIASKDMPNFLFVSSSPGTGKTTIAKMLSKELNTSFLYINGSQDNGKGIIGNLIKPFLELPNVTSFMSDEESADFKIVYIDEADGLTNELQKAFRAESNEYAKDARFIFTANNALALSEAIDSRFVVINFDYSREEILEMVEKSFLPRCLTILKQNKIKFDEDVVIDIIMNHAPDFRKCWEILCEQWYAYGEITTSKVNSEEEVHSVIGLLKKKSYKEVLAFMNNAQTLNVTTIWPILFKNIGMFTPTYTIENTTYLLGEYSYKSRQCADKYLNFMAFVSALILGK